jgi:hypothetical protein
MPMIHNLGHLSGSSSEPGQHTTSFDPRRVLAGGGGSPVVGIATKRSASSRQPATMVANKLQFLRSLLESSAATEAS